MTVQTQARPGIGSARGTQVRGVRRFILGIAAIAAAATGIGIAVSASNTGTEVLSPAVSEQNEALKRFHEDGASVPAPKDEVTWYPPVVP